MERSVATAAIPIPGGGARRMRTHRGEVAAMAVFLCSPDALPDRRSVPGRRRRYGLRRSDVLDGPSTGAAKAATEALLAAFRRFYPLQAATHKGLLLAERGSRTAN